MNKKSTSASLAIAAMLATTGGMNLLPTIPESKEKLEPRPDEVNAMSKKARKVYSKVMIETQNRDTALAAALEIENAI